MIFEFTSIPIAGVGKDFIVLQLDRVRPSTNIIGGFVSLHDGSSLSRNRERRAPIVGSPFSGKGLYLISAQSSGGAGQVERGSEIANCLSFGSSDRKNRQESSVCSDFWGAADVTGVDKIVKLPDERTRERWDAHQDACLDVAILGRLGEVR